MNALSLVFWAAVPVIAGVAYPSVKHDPEMLRWLNAGLSLYTLFFSVMVHEVCHGAAAYWCGDPTAKLAGRLSLNPLRHVDPFGSILFPLILHLSHASVMFGWAKPVPFNPAQLRQHPRDQVMVAIAGPLSNFTLTYLFFQATLILTVVFARLYPDAPAPFVVGSLSEVSVEGVSAEPFWFVTLTILNLGMIINLMLGAFNLIPFPPLDGSWLLKAILPKKAAAVLNKIQAYSFILLIAAVWLNLLDIFLYPASMMIAVLHLLIVSFYEFV